MTPVGFLKALARQARGVAAVEFALTLPFVVIVTMSAAELTNYTTTKMRVSQLALQIADNASRIGTGTALSNKTISEKQINDLLVGAGLQAGRLNIFSHGRVIISSLQPGAAADTYVVKWQRCKGLKNFVSTYPAAGTTEHDVEDNPFKVSPPPTGAVMFVEIEYTYQPLIGQNFIRRQTIKEVAAMTVRDNRDYAGGTNGIYNTEGATASSCSVFSAT